MEGNNEKNNKPKEKELDIEQITEEDIVKKIGIAKLVSDTLESGKRDIQQLDALTEKREEVIKLVQENDGPFSPDLAKLLISGGFQHVVLKYLQKFKGLNTEIALQLIETINNPIDDCGYVILDNTELFENLDLRRVALKLAEAQLENSKIMGISVILDNIDKFENSLYRDLALKLIEIIQSCNFLIRDYSLKILLKCKGLDAELAYKLLEIEEDGSTYLSHFVDKNLDKFKYLDRKNFEFKLVELGKKGKVEHSLEEFKELDNEELVKQLFGAQQDWYVGDNLDRFEGLDHRELALKLIERNSAHIVTANLEKFKGLDREVAMKLIEAKLAWIIIDKIEKFEGLNYDKELAMKLIETQQISVLLENSEKFENFNFDKELALKLFEAGFDGYLASHVKKFKGLDREIALKLIKLDHGYSVAENLDIFVGIDHKEIALKLIEEGRGGGFLAINLDKFVGLNHKKIALKLIEAGKVDIIAENLDKFDELDKEIALKLIEARESKCVAENLDKFKGLDREIGLALIEASKGLRVVENINKFKGLELSEAKAKIVKVVNEIAVACDSQEIQNMPNFDFEDLVKILIEAGLWLYLDDHFDELVINHVLYKIQDMRAEIFDFQNDNASFSIALNQKELALHIMRHGIGITKDQISNSDFVIKHDNKKLAIQLIKAAKTWFEELNPTESSNKA